MRRRKGMLIVVALLVLGVALVAGMGLMTSQVSNYRGVKAVEDAAQALCLAQAGLEDARLKLERDLDFPPKGDPGQTLFTYSEDVLLAGKRIGAYRVSIDTALQSSDYDMIRIISTGLVGPGEDPSAQRTLKVDLDTDSDPSRHATHFLPVKIEDFAGL